MCEDMSFAGLGIPELEFRYMDDKLRKDLSKKFVGRSCSDAVKEAMRDYMAARLEPVLQSIDDALFVWHAEMKPAGAGWHWVVENTRMHVRAEGDEKDIPACCEAAEAALKHMRICR